jgi:hypothetical protein
MCRTFQKAACKRRDIMQFFVTRSYVLRSMHANAANAVVLSLTTTQKHYKGSKWQPSSPRPPQLLRGVSCICKDSEGAPEALGRSTFTVNGICAMLAPTFPS